MTRYPIGQGADAALIEEARGIIAVPCAEASLWFFSLAGDTIVPAGKLATEPRARSGGIDPVTGTIYLPTARFAPAPTAGEKAPAIPGSSHVVVIRIMQLGDCGHQCQVQTQSRAPRLPDGMSPDELVEDPYRRRAG